MNLTAYHKILFWLPAFFVFIAPTHFASAQEDMQKCKVDNKACVIADLIYTAKNIDNSAWRDQVYREIVKAMAVNGDFGSAYELLGSIETPDTKAMSIRGIGMAVAAHRYSPEYNEQIFSKLREIAEEIEHLPSYAIALTYIAMSQAFAGDNEGSWKTAKDMENQALRNKAYGESAEIQAEHGDYDSAKKSIGFIDTESYRDKAYQHVSKILGDTGKLEQAYDAALSIGNPYKKALAIQYILDVKDTEDSMKDTPE